MILYNIRNSTSLFLLLLKLYYNYYNNILSIYPHIFLSLSLSSYDTTRGSSFLIETNISRRIGCVRSKTRSRFSLMSFFLFFSARIHKEEIYTSREKNQFRILIEEEKKRRESNTLQHALRAS